MPTSRYAAPMTGAQLTLYNSLTRSLEVFRPLDPERGVRVYSCGPTVYNYAHLGNLRAYVFTDTLSRVLSWKAGENAWGPLTHVINITDVGHLTSDADAGDDKMEAAARAQAKSIWISRRIIPRHSSRTSPTSTSASLRAGPSRPTISPR